MSTVSPPHRGKRSERRAAGRHGIHGVQYQVLKRLVQQVRIRVNLRQRVAEEIFRADVRLAHRRELRLEQPDRIAQTLHFTLTLENSGAGILEKIAEAGDDAVQIGEFPPSTSRSPR